MGGGCGRRVCGDGGCGVVVCLRGCPAAWLVRLPAWTAGCLAGRLPCRLAAWPCGCLAGWLPGRLAGCLVDQQAGPQLGVQISRFRAVVQNLLRFHCEKNPRQMASEPRVPPEDQSQREGEGERGRQRESERVREGEMLQSSGFCHKIQWSCSQFRSQACPEDIGGAQLVEQKCRVIAEQHRGSSFKKL